MDSMRMQSMLDGWNTGVLISLLVLLGSPNPTMETDTLATQNVATVQFPRTVLQLHEFGHQILNFGSGVDVLPAMCGNPWFETSWTRGCLICFRNKDIPKQI